MKQILHFYITKGENQYVGECVELAIVTQGKTLDELVLNINNATALHLESENASEHGLIASPLISINFEFAQAVNHD